MIIITFFISIPAFWLILILIGTWAPLDARFGPSIFRKLTSSIGLSSNILSFI
jgi:ABC-type dipeptide/oligopeptide/nickel transport system permease component